MSECQRQFERYFGKPFWLKRDNKGNYTCKSVREKYLMWETAWIIAQRGSQIIIPIVNHHGPIATHNMPCAVCKKESAVYEIGEGYFDPCWGCQSKGWSIKKGATK